MATFLVVAGGTLEADVCLLRHALPSERLAFAFWYWAFSLTAASSWASSPAAAD